MQSNEIRKRFLDFFEKRGHVILPSDSLVPENDPTTLFTGSGMQPMVPYLLGEKHPQGTRIVNLQKCFRGVDIEEVGDNLHTTFFEMLGNWSFGDYFREDQLEWIADFVANKENGLGLDMNRFYVTTFIGDEENNLPKDSETVDLWKKKYKEYGIDAVSVDLGSSSNASKVGMQNGRIFAYDAKENWWSRNGTPNNMPIGEPGGPDSEMFYDLGLAHNPDFGEHCHPACDCGRFVEIGNNVFMTYRKVDKNKFELLPKKNIDHGSGFERWAMVSQDKSNIFDTDLFTPILQGIKKMSNLESLNTKESRIIADHIRASVMLISDGVLPANSDQGYVLRRLLRRAVRTADSVGIMPGNIVSLVEVVASLYDGIYNNIRAQQKHIEEVISKEEDAFRMTLKDGLKQFEKLSSDGNLSGEDAFKLFSTYGFPFELTKEIAEEKGIQINEKEFAEEFKKHQDKSRTASEGKFKGGLAGTGEEELRFHTATHLLHSALRNVLGEHVFQKGSNITPERLRFDFSHGEKMTDEQKLAVENWINDKIKKSLPVIHSEMSFDEAKKLGAMGLFENKYGDNVSVYTIGDESGEICSRELCGGPHVKNTSELGIFKIKKEEASSAGIRRIKALLE